VTKPKTAVITGVTGQDGAYLAEFLLKKGYQVHGIKRRASSFNTTRIDHLYQNPHVESRNFILHYGDMTDSNTLIRSVQQVRPDEIYNLVAQCHVAVSQLEASRVQVCCANPSSIHWQGSQPVCARVPLSQRELTSK